MLVTRSNLTRTRVHRMRQARIQERIRPHSRARTHTRTTYNTGEPADLNFDPEVVRLLNVLLNDDGDEDRIPEHQQMKLDASVQQPKCAANAQKLGATPQQLQAHTKLQQPKPAANA